MPNNKQSNDELDAIPVHVACFIASFGRKDLSLNEIKVIALYMRAIAEGYGDEELIAAFQLPLSLSHSDRIVAKAALRSGSTGYDASDLLANLHRLSN